MKKNIRKVLYWTALVLCAAVFLTSAGILVLRLYESRKNSDLNQSLQNLKGTPAATVEAPSQESPTGGSQSPTESGEPTILPEYQALYQLNDELIGWLNIPDTNIDYPVMQCLWSRDFYLHRNFYKEYSYAGTLYVWPSSDVFTPSDNVTIFGHRMEKPSRDMFYELDKFKNSTWRETHQTFTFDTLYERHTYQLVLVFRTLGTSEGYPYYRFSQAANEAEFTQFMADIRAIADYETGVEVSYGDKLLCLSTCEYSLGNDSRFVVVAKRIS